MRLSHVNPNSIWVGPTKEPATPIIAADCVAAVVVAVLVLVNPTAAQLGAVRGSIPDLTGHWTLEKVTFPRASSAWRPGMPVESIDITQTANELRFEGPRGLYEGTAPMETYRLDEAKFTYVQNFGDWWRKSDTWIDWDGPTLVLRLRARAG